MGNAEPDKILLLDFVSEQNRGDAAIQIGLVELTRMYFPNATLVAIAEIGANQEQWLTEHYEYTLKRKVPVCGGLWHTSYPLGKRQNDRRSHSLPLLKFVRNILSLMINVCLLVAIAMRIFRPLLCKFLPRALRETLRHFYEADLVIWRGRNFRSRKEVLKEIYHTFKLVYSPLVCIMIGKPVACVGASVWPLRSPISRFLLKLVFKRCFVVTLRDKPSFDILRKLLSGDASKLALLPDLSFAALKDLSRLCAVRCRGPEVEKTSYKRLGVTIVDWREAGTAARERYVKAMRQILSYVLSDPNTEVFVVPQVTKAWESPLSVLEEIVAVFPAETKGRLHVIEGSLDIEKLLALYQTMDALVATRMHSAVFALSVGTPVLAVCYDVGPKWDILDQLGIKEYIVNYGDDEARVLSKFKKMWKGDYPLSHVERNLDTFYRMVGDNIKLVREEYGKIYSAKSGCRAAKEGECHFND